MRKVEIALLVVTLALLVLTPLAWVAAVSKWNQMEDLDGADGLILFAAPTLTILLLIVLVVRFANRNAKPS
jgi:FtsH-binding integral membrane protein